MRLMWYGWQPTVSHTDFAGILNANALYSFTIGFLSSGARSSTLSTTIWMQSFCFRWVCHASKLPITMLSRDLNSFHFPFAQQSPIPVLTPDALCACSLSPHLPCTVSHWSVLSLLSVANMILDFPKQLFDIAQREGEAHVFALQAEEKSEFWTQKMEVEVQQQQEDMLVMSAQESANQGGAPIQKPLSIIRKVMDLEADCMRARRLRRSSDVHGAARERATPGHS